MNFYHLSQLLSTLQELTLEMRALRSEIAALRTAREIGPDQTVRSVRSPLPPNKEEVPEEEEEDIEPLTPVTDPDAERWARKFL